MEESMVNQSMEDPGKLTGLRRRRRTFNRTAETAPKLSSQRSSGDMSLEAKGDITGSCYLVNKDESSFFLYRFTYMKQSMPLVYNTGQLGGLLFSSFLIIFVKLWVIYKYKGAVAKWQANRSTVLDLHGILKTGHFYIKTRIWQPWAHMPSEQQSISWSLAVPASCNRVCTFARSSVPITLTHWGMLHSLISCQAFIDIWFLPLNPLQWLYAFNPYILSGPAQ